MKITTDYLLHREVDQVLGCLMPTNALVIRMIIQTGLRVSDVLCLRTEQVSRSPQFWITEAKTGKRKKIRLTDALWRDVVDQAGIYWVFEHRTDPNKHRSRATVWADVHRAAKAYRIDATVGTHTFRKVYAVGLMHKYHDSDRVQRALNHASKEVTLIYMMADLRREQKNRERLTSRKNSAKI